MPLNIKPKVFIQYAGEDLEIAKRLYEDIKIAGVVPWMAANDLVPGQDWKMAINQEIKNCKYCILLLSSISVSKRGFVQKEFDYALETLKEIPPNEIFIIPARLDDCEVHYAKLRDLHRVDLFPLYEEGLNQILRVVEQQPSVQPHQRSNSMEDIDWIIGQDFYIYHYKTDCEDAPIAEEFAQNKKKDGKICCLWNLENNYFFRATMKYMGRNLFVLSEGIHHEETVLSVFPVPNNKYINLIWGVAVGTDFEGNPAAFRVLLSRKKLSTNELQNEFKKANATIDNSAIIIRREGLEERNQR